MAFDIDTSCLVAVLCEGFLHGTFAASYSCDNVCSFLLGCYTFLFAVSIYLMNKRSRNQDGGNRTIYLLSICLYLSCFAHFVLEFIHYYATLVC